MERTGVSDMYEKVGWPNKFTGDWSSGTLLYDDDLILYRYAQYYMFRAELYYYRKQYKEALGELNVVAQRAYGKADFYTSATQQDVLEALAAENRWEFAEEGNLWFTYIRLGYIDTYCPLKYWPNTGVEGGVAVRRTPTSTSSRSRPRRSTRTATSGRPKAGLNPFTQQKTIQL